MILIDAIELKKKSFRYETNCGQKFLKTVLVKDIDNAPTVDAMPVVHGHWIKKDDYIGTKYECSVCGHKDSKTTAIRGHYCWFCGAKMDEEADDETN